MADRQIIRTADIINGAEGECYMKFDGKRYLAMHVKNIEATLEKNKSEIARLGTRVKGNKTTSLKGSGSMTVYYMSSFMRRKMLEYMDTGLDFDFDIQIVNEDPGSATGRQDITLINCNIDSVTLAKLDIDDSELDEDLDFTFERATMGDEFKTVDGVFAAAD